MKKATVFLFTLIALVALSVSAQAYGQREYLSVLYPGASSQSFSINLSEMQTKGNHSYAPVNENLSADFSANIALSIMEEFERKNPNLVVIDWKPIYIHRSSDAGGSVFFVGIFIDHKPK